MLAVVEIDVRHFIKPAFIPVAVDMASEGYEQCLIDPVPHEVFMRHVSAYVFAKVQGADSMNCLRSGGNSRKYFWTGSATVSGLILRPAQYAELNQSQSLRSRLLELQAAQQMTMSSIRRPSLTWKGSSKFRCSMVARSFLTPCPALISGKVFHRLVAIYAGLVPFPQRLFVEQSDAEPVSHEAFPSQCIQNKNTAEEASDSRR